MQRFSTTALPALPANCRLLDGLSPHALAAALDFFDAEEKDFEKGAFLQRAGSPVRRFGLLLSGALQVFTDDVEGQRMLMANVRPGESYGESLCYLETPESPVYVQATEPCRILLLSTARLRKPAETPEEAALVTRFTAMLASKTLAMNDRIQTLSKRTLRKKLLAYFTQCARESGGKREFTIPMDRASLADYLGADRAALSRELSFMKKEGLIDFDRNCFRFLTAGKDH